MNLYSNFPIFCLLMCDCQCGTYYKIHRLKLIDCLTKYWQQAWVIIGPVINIFVENLLRNWIGFEVWSCPNGWFMESKAQSHCNYCKVHCYCLQGTIIVVSNVRYVCNCVFVIAVCPKWRASLHSLRVSHWNNVVYLSTHVTINSWSVSYFWVY